MGTVKKAATSVAKKDKKPVKKSVKKVAKKIISEDVVQDDTSLDSMLKKISDDASTKIDDLKKKFNQVDVDTKNKIVAGLSVVAAGLVVLAGVSKVNRNRKKRADKK
ncbi:MAG: hypothetical protein EOM88_01265 [Clostridia bacterium]|nr:hypothetical protein [Clostridia bacterium]